MKINERAYEFSLKAVRLSRKLRNESKEFDLARQLFRSGTSITANIEEAEGGVSRRDFVNRLSIAYKESRETKFWIRLAHDCQLITEEEYSELYKDCDKISATLFTIIRNTQNNESAVRR